MFLIVSPLSTIRLAIIPFELSSAIPFVAVELSLINALGSCLHSEFFIIVFELALEDMVLAEIDT